MLKQRHRRAARRTCHVGLGASAVMFVLSIANAPAVVTAAPTNGGTPTITVPSGQPNGGQPLTSGGSATAFALLPPSGAACTGDTAMDGYRVQTYMVPASVDPASLTFNSSGPLPFGSGASLRVPLYSAIGTAAYVNKTTAVTTGLITNIPTFSFGWVEPSSQPGYVPPGTYNIGFACTVGAASATQLDKYWNIQIAIADSAGDVPSKLTWSIPQTQATTSSSSTTTTSTTTTTIARATTTVAGATTTTTTASAVSTTIGAPAISNTSPPSSGSGARLSDTGGSSWAIALWAALALIFGRSALLLSRPVRVRE
jgi:hypothetical protein